MLPEELKMFRQEEKTKSTESSRRKSEFFQQYGRDVPMLSKVKTKAKAGKENFLPKNQLRNCA